MAILQASLVAGEGDRVAVEGLLCLNYAEFLAPLPKGGCLHAVQTGGYKFKLSTSFL